MPVLMLLVVNIQVHCELKKYHATLVSGTTLEDVDRFYKYYQHFNKKFAARPLFPTAP